MGARKNASGGGDQLVRNDKRKGTDDGHEGCGIAEA